MDNKTPTRETKATRQAKIERDAARYQWLRNKSDADSQQPYVAQERYNSWGKWFTVPLHGKEIDSCIDAAMKSK